MKYNINLAGKKPPNIIDKAVYFLLHYLRYILVFTQLIVLLVFFFRFSIDESIIDLKDSIAQKKAIIEVVQPILAEAKKIDDKAKESQKIIGDQQEFLSAIQYVLSIFPETLVLNSMEYDDGKLTLSGVALDPRHLQLFYTRLKKENKFPLVELQNVKRDEKGYLFTFNIDTGIQPSGKLKK
jgi:Tfp pilus assembly protein PilN